MLAVDYPPLTDTAELFTFFRAYVEAGWFPSVTTPLQTSAQLTRGVFMGVANPASPHLVGLTTGTNYLGSVGGGAKLVGGSGSDYFVGSVGATRMEGGAGNDMFYAHSATAYSAGKLTLEVSGNTVKGVPPKINVLVNGLLVAVGIEVTAAKETGQRQELSVMLPSGEITSIEIQHTNDVFITSIEDRNVYLHSVNLNSRVLTMNDGTYVRDYGLPPIPGQTDIVWGGRMFWNGVPVQEAMISVDAGGARIFGDAGIDTVVYETSMNEVRITQSASAVTVSFSTGLAPDEMSGIERLHFSDTKVALDINGNGGMAYRLYQAAFNRSPDEGGLGYQMNALDNGLNIAQVAANFIASPEFNATYGNLNDTQFVAQLYQNVLHRGPDAGGLAFHTGNLANGANTRANVLVGFSESPENQAALIGTIQNGMVYTL